jgi:hypothetical protein
MKTHLTPTLETVECVHCNEPVADRPFPPTEDDAAWSVEARGHRLGCAAILSRNGARPSPVAPTWARGTEYRHGDPAWHTRRARLYTQH